MAEFLHHAPCPECGSSDAGSVYDDGSFHCHKCGHHPRKEKTIKFVDSSPRPLVSRKLTQETCEKWGYGVGEHLKGTCQVANYFTPDGSERVAQKIRYADKTFSCVGDMKKAGLYGQHLWRDGGKRVVITEGEIDALSVSQLQDNKWPVVSLPSGAQSARKSLLQHSDWLEKFEEVVLMFDNDEPGKAAAHECVDILSPGKIKIASLPLKDASDMLKAGRGKEVIDAIWGAKAIRPDGIVSGTELWEAMSKDAEEGKPYPWACLNEFYRGLRKREIVTICAGSGIGKSSVVTELQYAMVTDQEETVGILSLEESTTDTAWKLVGVHLGERDLRLGGIDRSAPKYRKAFDEVLGSGRVFLYDHFGSTDVDNILAKIRYMVKGCGCTTIFLDHISIIVSGMEEGDERRIIDNLMTKLRSLSEEVECRLVVVSHLKRPEGTSHEEGGRTSLAQLRGSASIGQLSDVVIGLERNQQDEKLKNYTCLRSLKNRPRGVTGEIGWLKWDENTGRLEETTSPVVEEKANEVAQEAF